TSAPYCRLDFLEVPVPEPVLSSSLMSTRDSLMAGANPMNARHRTADPAANANIRQLVCGWTTKSASDGGTDAATTFIPHIVRRRPRASPAAANHDASQTSCRSM